MYHSRRFDDYDLVEGSPWSLGKNKGTIYLVDGVHEAFDFVPARQLSPRKRNQIKNTICQSPDFLENSEVFIHKIMAGIFSTPIKLRQDS